MGKCQSCGEQRVSRKEKWRAIPGFEGAYEVSSCGQIRTVAHVIEYSYIRKGVFGQKIKVKTSRTVKSKLIKPQKQKNGYLLVHLHKHGKRGAYLVHRLVALSFIPNVHKKEQVNHIDGDKENNCSDNLEWVTNGENQKHKIYILDNTNGPHPPSPVICLETGVRYSSIAEASRETGVCRCGIANVIHGINHHAGGFHWSLVG